VAPPYACAYSHGGDLKLLLEDIQAHSTLLGAKRNGTPYLAVATEEGSAIILKTSGRKGWDHGIYSHPYASVRMTDSFYRVSANASATLQWNLQY